MSSVSRQPLLQLQNVQFRWRADQPLHINIESLSVDAGERVFISGPSGSGKSTLLSLIGGVSVPNAGKVSLLGQDLGAMRAARRDQFRVDHLGIIFQLFNLVPYLSIEQNVLLPCQFSAKRRQRLAAEGTTPEKEARRLLAHLELDLGRHQGDEVVNLSIGQQQRVAAARALIGAPELIVADEPTSALDEGLSQRFVELLLAETATRNASVVFVSHDSRIAGRFDRHIRFETLNRLSFAA